MHTTPASQPSREYSGRVCRVRPEQRLRAVAVLVLDRFAVLWPCAADAVGGRVAAWMFRHLVLVAVETMVWCVARRAAECRGAAPGARAARLPAGRTGSDRACAGSRLARRGDSADDHRDGIAKSLARRSAQRLFVLRWWCAAAGTRSAAGAHGAGAPRRAALHCVSRRAKGVRAARIFGARG